VDGIHRPLPPLAIIRSTLSGGRPGSSGGRSGPPGGGPSRPQRLALGGPPACSYLALGPITAAFCCSRTEPFVTRPQQNTSYRAEGRSARFHAPCHRSTAGGLHSGTGREGLGRPPVPASMPSLKARILLARRHPCRKKSEHPCSPLEPFGPSLPPLDYCLTKHSGPDRIPHMLLCGPRFDYL